MTDQERFEAIWKGEAKGISESAARERLAEYVTMRGDLAAGRIAPRSVIGTGYKPGRARQLAMAWIESQIAGYEAGIATRGRSLDVNAANVAYAHRVEAAGVES